MEKCTITGTEIAKCMDAITTEQVYEACVKFLKNEYKRVEVVPCPKADVPQVSNLATKKNMFTLALICLNEEPYLKRLIPNLFGHPSIRRIVAIDGGSTDGTKAVLQEAGAEVYTHPWQTGYHDAVALQRNIMASYIPEEERFMFIDPDEICSKELLARLNEIIGMAQRYICLSRRTFKSYAGALKYFESGDASEQYLHYPDFQPRVYTNDRFLKFFRSPHHLTLNIGEPKNILGADILHYEKDVDDDNKKIDKQWTDLVEAGKKLGLDSWYVDHTSNRKGK
jgi:glycosyltransferase involved in cell wall biosynthesis